MQSAGSTPLTNLQLKILEIYEAHLSEDELLEVSGILSDFLTRGAIKIAGEAWTN